MPIYTVCKYYDYSEGTSFEVLEAYNDKRQAINRVIELA
jgi:hypothetical protein